MAQVVLTKIANGIVSNFSGASQTATEPLIVKKTAGNNTDNMVIEVNPNSVPPGATITLVELTYDILEVTSSGGTIELVDMATTRISESAADVWSRTQSGLAYTTHAAPSVGTFTKDLGAGAVTDMQARVDAADGYFCAGWRYESGAGTREIQIDDDATITVTYTPAAGSASGRASKRLILGVL